MDNPKGQSHHGQSQKPRAQQAEWQGLFPIQEHFVRTGRSGCFMHRKYTENKVTEEYVPNKAQDKTPERDLNEAEINESCDKDFKIMKMITKVRRVMHAWTKWKFQQTENIRKY